MNEHRLHIDWTACDGRGLCAELLPELLAEDDWGYPVPRDGMTEPLGRGEPADTPAHGARRRVDYCGSNSLLVRATTWDAVGGLDERFFPANYVDVDLGMKIRERGQVVLCEPRSHLMPMSSAC